ncbi:unnamed protein product [Mycena citricolor]|uniref:Uncharacterized protein n=1 Tax=Mycena citricolor TaxID=2018698 RepID=A0AAD2GTE7_9AGAR|nr:unnamed protein product [Mycena citricolor]
MLSDAFSGPLLILSLVALLFPFNSYNYVDARVIRGRQASLTPRGAQPSASAAWISAASSDGTLDKSTSQVGFFKQLVSTVGQPATNATVTVNAVCYDVVTLWVNGQPVGQQTKNLTTPIVARVGLNTTQNFFSVLVQNGTCTPAISASIQVDFSGSTPSSTFVSDSNWLAAANVPTTFPDPQDLSLFPPVVTRTLPKPPAPSAGASASPLSLDGSSWIWSIANASVAAPVGTLGFRKTFSIPAGKKAISGTALITCDNTFSLYVNEVYIAAPPFDPNTANEVYQSWTYAQQVAFPADSTSLVFDVIAQNFPGHTQTPDVSSAGFIAAMQVGYADGSSDTVVTDQSWSFSANFSSPSAFLALPPISLTSAVVQGKFGMAPWKQLLGTSDVLAAPSVPQIMASTDGSGDQSHHQDLSSVAIICLAIAVVAIGLAVAFLYFRRRKQPREDTPVGHTMQMSPTQFTTYERPRRTNSRSSTRTEDSIQDKPEPEVENRFNVSRAEVGGGFAHAAPDPPEAMPPPSYADSTASRSVYGAPVARDSKTAFRVTNTDQDTSSSS